VSSTDARLDPPTERAVDTEAAAGQALGLARALVRIPSVNPLLEAGGTGESGAARSAAAWLQGWGFESELEEVAPERFNVVARHPPEGARVPGRTLLFNGHLDTVGVSGMVVPPFAGDVRDGRLYGRGACDMKGGVAALLSASASLARTGHQGTLIVALTADEEHASVGMQALVAGGIRADAAVVCEPTELTVMPAHKGFVWLRVVFRGRAAHGSRPDVGIDAVRHAALYVAALDGLAQKLAGTPPHPLLGRPSFHVGTIQGGSAPSVYPGSCEVVLERRMLPGEDDADVEREFLAVLNALKEHVPEVDATLERTLSRPGTEVGVGAPLVRGLLGAAAAEGVEPRVEGMTAWVDAALLNEVGIPAVCFGPGSIAKAHSADEWAPVSEIEGCARILERFGRDFLGGTVHTP
jgi:acetylornithine deacetylase